MAEVHIFSLKVGTSHGLWQYKFSGSHDRVIMHSLRHILDRTCQLLGYDCADRSAVYLFYFSVEPFEGHQVCLEKMRETRDQQGMGCYYKVKQSNIGNFSARGLFPAIINANYLGEWPVQIYFKLEKSEAAGIVN
jgi:hypothetical protein